VGSELPPLILQRVLEILQWEPAVCGNIRAVCSTWSSLHDALRPGRLEPSGWAVLEGKLGWLQSVTELNLTECQDGVCGPLVELQIMPSLRSLSLPASCAESTVDAEAVYGLTTLTKLRFLDLREVHEYFYKPVGEVGEWVLDMSRLTTLGLEGCWAVTDKEVLALSSLSGLFFSQLLNLYCCENVTAATKQALRTAMAHLTIHGW
jgi:hypothetical protein